MFHVVTNQVERVSATFGVPLAIDKIEGPATEITFLGIIIDLERMDYRLPDDWVQDLRMVVHRAKKVIDRKLQSLLGKLNFTFRIIPMGCFFAGAEL